MKTRHILWSILLAASPLLANDFHPGYPLLDQQENRVIDSGKPLSTIKTCGACHDTDYIQAHSDHADAGAAQLGQPDGLHPWDAGPGFFGAWNPIDYDPTDNPSTGQPNTNAWLKRYGARHIGGGPVAGQVEMDCLLCHSNLTDNRPRNAALTKGDFAWANSAPLSAFVKAANRSTYKKLTAARKPNR